MRPRGRLPCDLAAGIDSETRERSLGLGERRVRALIATMAMTAAALSLAACGGAGSAADEPMQSKAYVARDGQVERHVWIDGDRVLFQEHQCDESGRASDFRAETVSSGRLEGAYIQFDDVGEYQGSVPIALTAKGIVVDGAEYTSTDRATCASEVEP